MDITLDKLYKLGQNLSTPLSEEDTYEAIVRDMIDLTHGGFGSIFIRKDGVLERVYASVQELYSTRIRKNGFTYKAAELKNPSYITIHKLKNIQPHLFPMGVKSVLFVPLLYKNKSFGVISIDSTEKNEYSQSELQSFKVYGVLASMAIKQAEFFTESRQALEIRDFFISTAAHELRTPLTAVSGYVQLLHKRISSTDSLESRWIEKLMEETNRFMLLTKELLEVNRIRAGVAEYTLREHSLLDILMRTINRIMYHYPNRDIQLESALSEEASKVIADYDKLVQVFYNIIDNAIKFSDQSQSVKVSLSYKKPNLQVKIQDKGTGIAHDRIKEILGGSFHSIDDGSEKTGIGIGLFLVKNIIQKHNGTISISSTKKKGTTVDIKLPRFINE